VPTAEYNQTDPAYIIADLNARIRSLENKYNVLTERLLVINQNMIQEYKKLMNEMRNISQDTKKTRMGMLSTQEVVKDMVKEMNIFAKKDQIKVLEKYMDLLNILKLVTDEQLDKRLEKFKIELKENKIRGR
jgi:hypothetical protein